MEDGKQQSTGVQEAARVVVGLSFGVPDFALDEGGLRAGWEMNMLIVDGQKKAGPTLFDTIRKLNKQKRNRGSLTPEEVTKLDDNRQILRAFLLMEIGGLLAHKALAHDFTLLDDETEAQIEKMVETLAEPGQEEAYLDVASRDAKKRVDTHLDAIKHLAEAIAKGGSLSREEVTKITGLDAVNGHSCPKCASN